MIYLNKLPFSNFPTGHEYLLEFFEDYDYRKPRQEGKLDYRNPDNWVGYQQRAFLVWWALECCGKIGKVGIDIGSAAIQTPYCLSTDKFMAGEHPVYGGEYSNSQLKLSGEDLSLIGDGTIPLITGNHILEHLPGDLVKILNEQWIPKLSSGGVIAQIMPDGQFVNILAIDSDHKQSYTANDFEFYVLRKLKNVEVIEFNTLDNHFSFNLVVRKK